MLSIIITSFKEPNTIARAIEAFTDQKTKEQYELYVLAPDKETLEIGKNYSKLNKSIKIFKDPGKGKSFALNMILPYLKGEIILLSDGDVYVSKNSIFEIKKLFDENKNVGCVAGRPIPLESKKAKYGYWANFLFDAAHNLRKNSSKKGEFIECSGYLFAFKNNVIKNFPVDVAEDTIIPFYFWKKGYQIKYCERAKVFVKNTNNWKDWIDQKTRTSRGHETLKNIRGIQEKRVKTLYNESKGVIFAIKYFSNTREFFWTIQLILARLYMWVLTLYQIRIMNKTKIDAWRRVESTK